MTTITESEMDALGLGAAEREALQGVEPDQLDEAQLEPGANRDERASEPVEAEQLPPIATYQAEPVQDYDDRVKALDERADGVAQQFKAGDITFDDFRKEERAIQDERRALDDQQLKATISAEQAEQQAVSTWRWQCDKLIRDAAAVDGVDYKSNPRLWAALDVEVRRLGQDEANKDKPGVWFLETAHKAVLGDLGRTARQHPAADERDGGGHGLEQHSRAGGADDFARLDALSGLELERELARLPAHVADEYLRAGS